MRRGSSKQSAARGGEVFATLAPLVQDVVAGWRAAQSLKGGRVASSDRARATAKTARGRPGGERRDPSPTSSPSGDRLQALGWFLAAGVILALPRAASPFDWAFLKRAAPTPSPAEEVAAAEAKEPGRGRGARHPGQIPLRGWRDIFWRAWRDFNHDNIPQVAGGVAFFSLLAVFPAMAALVSLYGLFFDLGAMERQIAVLNGVMPAAALGLIGDQLARLTQAHTSGLGVAFVLSLLVSLWSANAGLKAMIVGLNVAFEEREKRNLVKLNLVSLAFTLGALAFTILAMAAIVAVPVVLAFVGYKGAGLTVLRWPILLLVAIGALSVLYRYGPSRALERWKWLSWGSALAAVLWLAVSLMFSVYVAHFGSYNRTYGSLGAAVGFMSWIWVSTIAVLFGAEINSEIEHQTAVDTTTGAPAVMGERGAYMADTLGDARHGGQPHRRKASPVPGRENAVPGR